MPELPRPQGAASYSCVRHHGHVSLSSGSADLLDATELQLEDLVGERVVAGGRNVCHVAARARRHAHAVIQQAVLVHDRVDVAGGQPVADLRPRMLATSTTCMPVRSAQWCGMAS